MNSFSFLILYIIEVVLHSQTLGVDARTSAVFVRKLKTTYEHTMLLSEPICSNQGTQHDHIMFKK